jgi:hypothetical protein
MSCILCFKCVNHLYKLEASFRKCTLCVMLHVTCWICYKRDEMNLMDGIFPYYVAFVFETDY